MGDPTKWKEGSLDAFMKMNHKTTRKPRELTEEKKIMKLNKKNKDSELEMTEEEREATLALAMQYQYYTESEEDEDDADSTSDLQNTSSSVDNSAW
jgi:hypothetical protein